MNLKQTIIRTGIAGGLIAGVTYLFRLKRTSAELETVNRISIHKLDFKGLVVRIDVQLKNPTKTKFKIKFPFVKLLYKHVTIGSSKAVDKDIEIPAFGEAVAEKIMIEVPVLSIFSAGAGMIKSLLNAEAVKLKSKTISTIDLGWKKIPYDKTEELTIKK